MRSRPQIPALIVVLALLLCSDGLCDGAVNLDKYGEWKKSGWAGQEDARQFSLVTKDGPARFTVHEPDKRKVWIKRLNSHIDTAQYPIMAMRYSATDVSKNSYVIWIDDGTGPSSGGLIVFVAPELVADGKVHVLKKDLRTVLQVNPENEGDKGPRGPIKTVALGIQAGKKTPATLELFGIHFLPEEEEDGTEIKLNVDVTSDENKILVAVKEANVAMEEVEVMVRVDGGHWRNKLNLGPFPSGKHVVEVLGLMTNTFCRSETLSFEVDIDGELDEKIIQLVKNLGAESYRDRRDAEKQLANCGDFVLPFVKEAAESTDPEVRMRARRIMEQLAPKDSPEPAEISNRHMLQLRR